MQETNALKGDILLELGIEIVGKSEVIPAALTPRSESITLVATSMLAVSFLIIALARLGSGQQVYSLVRAVYKNKQVEKIVREEYPLNNLTSIFLILNHVLAASALIFLSLAPSPFTDNPYSIFTLLPIPFLVVFLPWLSLIFIGALTKEKEMVAESRMNTLLFAHFSGLVYSLVLLVWAFNIQWKETFIYIFAGIALFIWLYRFLRGFIAAFSKGAPWYYIILYFCTLEILPFVLCFYALNYKIEEII